jgi:hypothetical protein
MNALIYKIQQKIITAGGKGIYCGELFKKMKILPLTSKYCACRKHREV